MGEKRIVVLVSGGGTNLQALIDAQASGELKGGKITCVISSKPGVYALERSAKAGIKTIVHCRKDYADVEEYSEKMLELLRAEGADLVVTAGFMTILSACVPEALPNRMINVHPALIPAFCGKGFYGLKVHEAALNKGVKVTGATVHFVTEGADEGPIILQGVTEVKEDDTPETLQRRVMETLEWPMLVKAVSLVCQDRVKVENGRTKITDGE